jgi:hypothetical protein
LILVLTSPFFSVTIRSSINIIYSINPAVTFWGQSKGYCPKAILKSDWMHHFIATDKVSLNSMS